MDIHSRRSFRSNQVRAAVSVVTMILLLAGVRGAAMPLPVERPGQKEAALAALPDREVRCTDGSVLNLKFLDEKVTLITPYGKLVIPFAKIVEIECATRIPEDISKRIDSAISKLGNAELKKREAASAELARLAAKPYHALLKVEENKDAEVRRRVKQLLEKIRETVSEENLAFRRCDVIYTADSKIAGQIEGVSFKVHTDQFGELRLKLSDVRTIRAVGQDRDGADKGGNALPDPGHLATYQAQVGRTFTFRVTGAAVGNVWGTDVYTLDSTLAVAAVHAGVVKIGRTATVKVKILPPRGAFLGSVRHGVTTHQYAQYPGAYEFVKK